MSDIQVPDCICPNPDDDICKWKIEFSVKLSHMEDTDALSSTVPWKMDNIPQALAQVLLFTIIDVVNKNGAEVYKEWLAGCVQGKNGDFYKLIEGVMDSRDLKLPVG